MIVLCISWSSEVQISCSLNYINCEGGGSPIERVTALSSATCVGAHQCCWVGFASPECLHNHCSHRSQGHHTSSQVYSQTTPVGWQQQLNCLQYGVNFGFLSAFSLPVSNKPLERENPPTSFQEFMCYSFHVCIQQTIDIVVGKLGNQQLGGQKVNLSSSLCMLMIATNVNHC